MVYYGIYKDGFTTTTRILQSLHEKYTSEPGGCPGATFQEVLSKH